MFETGFGRRCITPPVGTRLFGYPNNRKAESVHDDLYANVLAFRQGNISVLLISLDICVLSTEQAKQYRDILAAQTGILADNIIITAIHTHSGPNTKGVYGWGEMDDAFMGDILLPALQAATQEAVEKLVPARMGIGMTHSNAAINRRQRDNGRVILGQNPDGPYDPKMYMLSFSALDGTPIVNMIHYGAHPTACGPGPEITRDWPGYMVDTVEERTGSPVVFFNGAEGDTGPRISNGYTIGDITYVEEVGVLAGKDAVKAWENVQPVEHVELAVYTEEISLLYDPLPSKEEVIQTLSELSGRKLTGTANTLKARCEGILAFYESGKPVETAWNFRQTVVKIGPVAIVPYPFEMFCEIAMKQQEKSPFLYTLCLSDGNGTECYLPTEKEIPYGGYEVESFKRQRVFAFKDDTDKRIVAENGRLLQKLAKQ